MVHIFLPDLITVDRSQFTTMGMLEDNTAKYREWEEKVVSEYRKRKERKHD